MGSFLKAASKQVTDVRSFLRDSAGGNNIKYAAEKGAKHLIYIPAIDELVIDDATGAQTAVKKLQALQGAVHEWTDQNGKYRAVCCLKGTHITDEAGNVVNDGSCPFCDRLGDAWNIANYRKELEEATCTLTGEQREEHLKKFASQCNDERKAKDARNYMYLLVVKFRLDKAGNPTIGADGMPEYDLKVMKLSASRVDKIQQQVINTGSELPGSELIFQYPNTDDRRLQVGQSTVSVVFPTNALTTKFPGLTDKINQDVAKFEWEGIEKSFPEWEGMSTAEATTVTNGLFKQWDEYQKDKITNPAAKYLEYVVATPTTKPSLGNEAPVVGAMPTVPEIPVVPGIAGAGIPVVPTAEPSVGAVFDGQGVAPTIMA